MCFSLSLFCLMFVLLWKVWVGKYHQIRDCLLLFFFFSSGTWVACIWNCLTMCLRYLSDDSFLINSLYFSLDHFYWPYLNFTDCLLSQCIDKLIERLNSAAKFKKKKCLGLPYTHTFLRVFSLCSYFLFVRVIDLFSLML